MLAPARSELSRNHETVVLDSLALAWIASRGVMRYGNTAAPLPPPSATIPLVPRTLLLGPRVD